MVRWSAGAVCVLILVLCLPSRVAPRHEVRKRAEGDAAREYRLSGLRDEHGRIDVAAAAALRARRPPAPARLVHPEATTFSAPWVPHALHGHAGRARALVIHPAHPETMWIATGSGGVWRTDDAGESWRILTGDIGLPSGCLVADTRDPTHLYWGTGERFHAGGPGAGIWETTDGGETWAQMPSTAGWPYVLAIALSPSDPRLIVASVPGASSADGAIQRSTDGGATWTATLMTGFTSFDLVADPSDASRFLAASRARRTTTIPTGCVWRSSDSGASWTLSTGSCAPDDGQGINPVMLAYASSDARIAYALSRAGGLLASTDGGASFAVRNKAAGSLVARWTTTLWVSPVDPSFLLIGGGVSRSTDGGATFTNIAQPLFGDVAGHPDTQAFVAPPGFDGVHERRLYWLNDGGIDVLDDVRALEPRPRSLDANLATTESWAAGGSRAAGYLVGAIQDSGLQAVPYASTSPPRFTQAGDGTVILFDPLDARYAYGSAQTLLPFRIDFQTGVNESLWTTLHDDRSTDNVTANFVSPIVLDPNSPGRMLAGGYSLWKCENVRDAHEAGNPALWTEIKPRVALPAQFDELILSAVAVAPGDSNQIWVAYNGGRVERTTSGTASTPAWDVVDDNGAHDPLPNRKPLRILIDRTDSRHVLVAFGGFAPDNLWATSDGGGTWTRATGSGAAALPPAPIWALAQHPKRAATLYAGTEVGVYQSDDAGSSWRLISGGAFSVAAQDLSFVQGTTTLLVGTFGRGLFTLETSGVPCLCRPPRVSSGGT